MSHAPLRPAPRLLGLAGVLIAFAWSTTPTGSAVTVAGAAHAAGPFRQVDALFAEWDRPDSPGCVLGVLQNGEFVYRRGYGMADLEHAVPFTSRTVTQVRSMSKQFTAMAVLLLERDGALSLDDDVRRYLPDIPDYGKPITIRHLLNHTSGLRDYFELFDLAGVRREGGAGYFTEEEAVAMIRRQRELNHPPGERFSYTNSGYLLLKRIVEKSSGRSFGDFTADRIFLPLGMRHTHFREDVREVMADRAQGYERVTGGRFAILEDAYPTTGPGGLLTTLEDLARWERNFLDPLVGDRALIARMLQRPTYAGGEVGEYAAGLYVSHYRGLPVIRHDGGGAGYRAEKIRFPDEGLTIMVLCNVAEIDAVNLAGSVADVLLAEQLSGAPAEAETLRFDETYLDLDRGALEPLTGVYGGGGHTEFEVTLDEGALWVILDGGAAFRLRPLESRRFRVVRFPNAPAVISFPETGDAPRLELLIEGTKQPYVFARVAEPAAAELMALAGRYRSDELAVTYDVVVEDGHLAVHLDGPTPHRLFGPLRAAGADAFVERGTRLTFQRGKNGAVLALHVHTRRVEDVKLAREG